MELHSRFPQVIALRGVVDLRRNPHADARGHGQTVSGGRGNRAPQGQQLLQAIQTAGLLGRHAECEAIPAYGVALHAPDKGGKAVELLVEIRREAVHPAVEGSAPGGLGDRSGGGIGRGDGEHADDVPAEDSDAAEVDVQLSDDQIDTLPIPEGILQNVHHQLDGPVEILPQRAEANHEAGEGGLHVVPDAHGED